MRAHVGRCEFVWWGWWTWRVWTARGRRPCEWLDWYAHLGPVEIRWWQKGERP